MNQSKSKVEKQLYTDDEHVIAKMYKLLLKFWNGERTG